MTKLIVLGVFALLIFALLRGFWRELLEAGTRCKRSEAKVGAHLC